jgi:hypothetical protein
MAINAPDDNTAAKGLRGWRASPPHKSWTSLEKIVLGTPGCAAYAENYA